MEKKIEESKELSKTAQDKKFSLLNCSGCNEEFKVDNEFVGVITCPYCGTYIEG